MFKTVACDYASKLNDLPRNGVVSLQVFVIQFNIWYIVLLNNPKDLSIVSKMSEVTIEFLVLWLVKMNHLFCDSHLGRGDYHVSLEIILQKEVSEGDWKLFETY